MRLGTPRPARVARSATPICAWRRRARSGPPPAPKSACVVGIPATRPVWNTALDVGAASDTNTHAPWTRSAAVAGVRSLELGEEAGRSDARRGWSRRTRTRRRSRRRRWVSASPARGRWNWVADASSRASASETPAPSSRSPSSATRRGGTRRRRDAARRRDERRAASDVSARASKSTADDAARRARDATRVDDDDDHTSTGGGARRAPPSVPSSEGIAWRHRVSACCVAPVRPSMRT